MLLYCNRSFWRLVLERRGSIVYRTGNILAGLVLAAIGYGVQEMIDQGFAYAPDIPHHYAMHALGAIVAFAVVFRTNLGWQRYWEAMTQLHFMYSKWADAYLQFIAFSNTTIEQTKAKGGDGSAAKIERVRAAMHEVSNNFSLLSALAAHRLSHGDTQRMEKRSEVASWSQQVVLRRELRLGKDITGATKLPEFITGDHRQRISSEGGEWDSAYVIQDHISEEKIESLRQSPDRVNLVMYWVILCLSKASKDIDIAPPIQSRMYQEMSNGMLGFSNSLKIADVPFPFPYAQLLTLILTVYSIFIPLYIVIFTQSKIAGPLLTFLLFQGIWGVNEVAKELENPYGPDQNDISLADFHARFLDFLQDIPVSTDGHVRKSEPDEPKDRAEMQVPVPTTSGAPPPQRPLSSVPASGWGTQVVNGGSADSQQLDGASQQARLHAAAVAAAAAAAAQAVPPGQQPAAEPSPVPATANGAPPAAEPTPASVQDTHVAAKVLPPLTDVPHPEGNGQSLTKNPGTNVAGPPNAQDADLNPSYSDVIDQQLLMIGEHMNQHLAKLTTELEQVMQLMGPRSSARTPEARGRSRLALQQQQGTVSSTSI